MGREAAFGEIFNDDDDDVHGGAAADGTNREAALQSVRGDKAKKEQAEKEALQKKLEELTELRRQDAERIKELEKTREQVNRIQSAFTGKEDEEEKLRREIDARARAAQDPVGYVEDRLADVSRTVEERVQKAIQERITPIVSENRLRDAQEWINKKYDVDWENKAKMEATRKQLDRLSEKFRAENPREALLTALHLSGSLSKKVSDDIPFMEGAGGAGMSAKQAQSEAEKIKKSIADQKEGKLFQF